MTSTPVDSQEIAHAPGVPAIEQFIRLIEPDRDLWPSAHLGYSAVLQGGEWRNLFSSLRFDWTVGALAAAERVVEGPRIRAGTIHLSFVAAIALLREAGGESFEMMGLG